jgi:hypothetical protein
MEVTDRTDALWEAMLMDFSPKATVGLARVREISSKFQQQSSSSEQDAHVAIARWADSKVARNARRDTYYAETYGGDWPEDH